MKDTAKPMPPSGALAADRIAVLESWISAGMPKGTCAVAVASTETVCTSNTQWTRGNHDSPNMRPGGTCISCHNQGEGPSFDVAGTVYATLHEPNDCNGGVSGSGPITVEITDANGKTYSLAVNAVGNFSMSSRTGLATPYTAKVTANGKTRAMNAAQTDGDCNGCHTERGTQSAPGRIMAP
jgi:hypothetical protein